MQNQQQKEDNFSNDVLPKSKLECIRGYVYFFMNSVFSLFTIIKLGSSSGKKIKGEL